MGGSFAMSAPTLKKFIIAAFGITCLTMLLNAAAFGHDKHGKRKRRGSRHAESACAVPADYKERCGGCHMAYPACLLPEASWRNLLDSAGNHFGAELTLDSAEKAQVSAYLLANAADRSGGRLGRKIMRHLDGQTPDRISTLSYIQHKHRKIDPAVFSRKAVGGLQNCVACHTDAERGDFDDDKASIPR